MWMDQTSVPESAIRTSSARIKGRILKVAVVKSEPLPLTTGKDATYLTVDGVRPLDGRTISGDGTLGPIRQAGAM